ncbi:MULTISPECIES: hypothetical protein [Proteus]|uniref:hypothetical protein n=1 Tax=Proteus TaxID=583 RepID=UPI000D6E38D3|nr:MULTISPECIES: hypothetical protein [Proteus]MBG2836118.1 hypothetical protein [Proteus terrae subsp. cibarius]MBG2867238.1 hypothetical protein [Proteus terrae subsp. cibarius]MCT8230123.1 hypothetical protein [Proteus terrae]MDR9741119.1 hypothetical protein [Proteus terrae]
MQAKLAYQWKQQRRGRLSFLGLEIAWTIFFSIAENLADRWFISLYPEKAELVTENYFYYQFSFTSYGLMELVFLIIQVYIFTLILSQRIRDIGIGYPIVISIILTVSPILLTPYLLFNAPSMLTILYAILLITGLVALLAPSAYKVDINKVSKEKDNNSKMDS